MFRYKCYFYDEDANLYYLKSRFYNPLCGRFLTDDDEAYIDESSFIGFNLFTYCGNDPVNKYDPNGNFPILACILGLTALAGMGLTIGGVASDNHLMTAIGLTMIAIPALISGGMALYCAGASGTIAMGKISIVTGILTGLFISTEYQEVFSGNNWMLDAGMNEGWYNILLLATASLATLGASLSSFGVYKYQSFGNKYWRGGWKEMKSHFLDHGERQMGYKNVFDYTNGARAVINKGGVYVSKLNAYAQWIAGDKYFFVGVGHNSNLITTYFIKTIKYAKYLSLL